MKPKKIVCVLFCVLSLLTFSSCSKTSSMPFSLEDIKNANQAQAMNDLYDTVHITDSMENIKSSLGQENSNHDIYVRRNNSDATMIDVYMKDSNGEESYITDSKAYIMLADKKYLTVFYTNGYYENIVMPSYNVFKKSLIKIDDTETVKKFEEEENSYTLTTILDFSKITDDAYKTYLNYYWGISQGKGTNVYTIDKDSLLITSLKQYYSKNGKLTLYYSIDIQGNVNFEVPSYANELISSDEMKTITVITDNERNETYYTDINSLVDFNSSVGYNKYTDEQCTKAFDYLNTPASDFTLYFLTVVN